MSAGWGSSQKSGVQRNEIFVDILERHVADRPLIRFSHVEFVFPKESTFFFVTINKCTKYVGGFDWSESGYIVGSDHCVPLPSYSCACSTVRFGYKLHLEFEWGAFFAVEYGLCCAGRYRASSFFFAWLRAIVTKCCGGAAHPRRIDSKLRSSRCVRVCFGTLVDVVATPQESE